MGFSKFFILSIFLLVQLGCITNKGDIYILPENFRGYFVVIFGQKGGESISHLGEYDVFRVPDEGILIVEEEVDQRWVVFPKFYLGDMVPSQEIPFSTLFDELSELEVEAFGGSVGSVSNVDEGGEIVCFQVFFIGNKDEIRNAIESFEKVNISELLTR